MGLCKCPKKKVTNQFCFEHKVNVCEYCMIDGNHKTCIVGPYLNWLENSNFDSRCNLCKNDLQSEDCIRLCCYHILHLECLNQYCLKFPANTAPAGYTCPICSKSIFTLTSKLSSPVSKNLEKILSKYSWANDAFTGMNNNIDGDDSATTTTTSTNNDNNIDSRSTILLNGQASKGGSLLDNSTKINMIPSTSSSQDNSNNFVPKILHNSLMNKSNYSSSSTSTSNTPLNVQNITSFISTNNDLSFGSTSSIRSKFDSLESRRPLLSSVDEIAEDKYRTKSPIEFLSRWLRSRSTYIKNHSTMSTISIYKKFILIGFLLILFLFILIHYFIKYGRQSADNDPFLNPNYDPNLRNEND